MKKLTVITLLVALLVGIFALNAFAQEEYNLVLTTYSSEQHITSRAFQYFAEQLQKKTDGRVKFKTFYGTLGGPGEILPLIKDGTVDIGIFLPNYYPAEFTLTAIKEMAYAAYQPNAAIKSFNQLFEEFPEMQQEYLDKGIVFLTTYSGNLNPLVTKKKIETLDDLKGMKVRAGGRDAYTTAAWGMVPVQLNFGEIYEGLMRGVIGGVYGVTIGTDVESLHLQDIAKYFMDPGAGQAATLNMAINKESYDKLPDDIKQAMQEAIDEAVAKELELRAARQTHSLNMILDAGAEFYQPPQDVVDKMTELSKPATHQAWVDDCVKAGYPEDLANKVLNRYIELNQKYREELEWKPLMEEYNELKAQR